MSRNGKRIASAKHEPVTSREGRVSRNVVEVSGQLIIAVTSREGRVSRNTESELKIL